MGLVFLPIFLILIFLGKYITNLVFPSLRKDYSSLNLAKKVLINLLTLLFALPMIALCLYLLDSNFPSAVNGFSNNGAMLLFFMAPLLLGASLALTKFAAIKIVNPDKKDKSNI
ncbi:hypothetical protein [Agaribacterium sp. ZY112]|uniref:hypothetical protein n=1 Tax=Agaribacterium sp. ZY112 TaxID=3233574 RepID=UPI0035263121